MKNAPEVRSVDTPWLTAAQARQYLHISAQELLELIHSGKIRAFRRKRTFYLHASDLDAYMLSLPLATE